VPRPATPISDQELIALLSDNDASLAMDAALRLVQRPSAIENLVTAYQSQDQNLKTRSLWVIKRLGEPARLYLVDIIANPNNFHPKTVRAAKELIGSIENAVQPAPVPAPQPAPTVPPQAQPGANAAPAAPAVQPPAPQPAAQPSVPKDTEDRIRIQEQLRAKKRELSRLQARCQLQSRMSARYRNPMLTAEISELQDHVRELEGIAAKLAK
jgi:hypothetical protein